MQKARNDLKINKEKDTIINNLKKEAEENSKINSKKLELMFQSFHLYSN